MKTADFKRRVPCTPTRFYDAETDCRLWVGKIAPGLWQTVVEQDGIMAATGAQSKTKIEAFSVLPEVARSWGFDI